MADSQKKLVAQTNAEPQKSGAFNLKNRIIWTIVFVVIAALSIWAVISQTNNFSFESFWEFIKNSNPFWLAAAVVSMLGFIFLEGFALLYICRAFGFKKNLKSGFVYSSADIYVSAITPSATGGQPASAYFMMKDGIPGTIVAAALVCNIVMYTAALVALGLVAIISSISTFFEFSIVSKLLIVSGLIVQVCLLFFFIMILIKKGLLEKLCTSVIKFLGKLKLIRKVDRKIARLQKKMDAYSKNTELLSGKGKLLITVFAFNLLQRLCQVMVTPLTYLASGGELSKAIDVFIIQIYVSLGANCIPIPGAVGVTDYLMLDGFEMLGIENFEFLEIFSRFLSFYMCIIICGLAVLISCITYSDKRKKRRTQNTQEVS